jgi:hypothetical protein
MGYWIENSRGKLEMISASEIRQRVAARTLGGDTPCVKLSFVQELNPFWKKPFQPLRTSAEFTALFQNSAPTHAQEANGLETFGWILLGLGLLCIVFFLFFYSTSGGTIAGEVYNVGLMQNRTLGCIVGVGLAIIGTLMALLGRERV